MYRRLTTPLFPGVEMADPGEGAHECSCLGDATVWSEATRHSHVPDLVYWNMVLSLN
jgi:hypothetical protein